MVRSHFAPRKLGSRASKEASVDGEGLIQGNCNMCIAVAKYDAAVVLSYFYVSVPWLQGYEDMAEFEDALHGTFEDFLQAMPHIETKIDEKNRLVGARM